MKLVHLSDLHLGSSYFVPEWGDRVVATVNDLKPDIIVITGDLTTEGHVHEYDQVAAYLKRFADTTQLVVPGNHDARNEGYVIFEELFGTRYPFYENQQVAILGIDSSQPDVDDGHVGRANYPLIRNRLSRPVPIRILAMHHHLVPIPGTGRERHIPTDAGDVLKLCLELDINIVLSGH
ncbi:MAG: metallophosphoesterase, partial [candidate division WOR-3 bacterium]